MSPFVIDASATMPWCFDDEATTWSDELLNQARSGVPLAVPAHWPVEIANVLRVGERKGRITPQDADEFLEDLNALRVRVQPALEGEAAKALLRLSRKHSLTSYDAAYLELAMRLKLPMATQDGELISAEGVTLL